MLGQPQTLPPSYRSELPDYLLGIIDQITKADECQVLRYDFTHYSLEELVFVDPEPRQVIWLFVDPAGINHLLSSAPHPLLPPRKPRTNDERLFRPDVIGEPRVEQLKLVCSNLLSNKIQVHLQEDISRTKIISIDQVRLNCQANLYTNPQDLDRDIRRVIAWNQLFKAKSTRTFEYLSALYEKIIHIVVKKDLFRKFLEIKNNDINRLYRYQLKYRTHSNQWPFVPSSFREYEEIDRYVPTPPQRTPIINQRLQSKKVPVDCPDTCVCLLPALPQGKDFCKFTLLNGWETQCVNRARKLQCNHADKDKQQRCRNSEIRKHNRKICAGKAEDDGINKPQIEERLIWGIDLFTRNIIYNCLPEIDIDGIKKVNNDARRNYFIQYSLSKAMNFMGAEGYNLLAICNYIKEHSEVSLPNQNNQNNQPLQEQEGVKEQKQGLPLLKLFSERDYHYADLLIRNYELAEDKTGFRVYTKGKGAICIDPKGIEQGSFIVEYFGEIYEPWRWYDREDFIKETLKKKKLKNYIPEFYNIYLEKHADEPLGYDILVVDPSKMGNFSSRFSHSCDPNCGTVITVSQGRYYIGMYAFRPIAYGEQLTFDYCSMTESNYQHLNSICLCGMKKCRGNYLQLSNTKSFNNLMDNRNCFFTRNSAILKSTGPVTIQDLSCCADHNIKDGFLEGTPKWIIRWMARVLAFIETEGEIYKHSLMDQWRATYPWETTPQEGQVQREEKIELYSETSKQDLIMLRFQNLITSVDKLKYFYSRNELNQQPPIYIQKPAKILDVLVTRHDSVLLELQQCFIKFKCEDLARLVENFLERISRTDELDYKLFLFRLCCLVVSHRLLFLTQAQFSYELLSDIIYFYAFTFTYFSPNEFKSFEADEIVLGVSEILGKSNSNERKEKSKKKYSGPFVWGQVVSWYKQTIVCPEASLSQDRRGTLSYPLIKSIMRSEYPYEKQSRSQFHKVLLERPANSWPPAPGCDLSFKNPYKLYGTLLFESVHSRDELAGKLPKEGLLQSCLGVANSSFREKLDLFKIVEGILGSTPPESAKYHFLFDFTFDFDANVPLTVRNSNSTNVGEPRKRIKNDEIEPSS